MRALILCFLTVANCFGQDGRYNNWHFGIYSALTFNTGVPVFLNGSALQSDEACASISDTLGNLLFYTNGNEIWDSTNTIMPNGSGLLGWGDVQQGVLIIPLPNSNSLFYVFTIGNPTMGYTKELRYSIIDMTLNNSLGDVTLKNILLDFDVTEKLTATKHANGNDIWIIEHPYTTNQFKAYLLTSTGLDTTPVISYVGLIPIFEGSFAFAGAIKISNNGCWLISTIRETFDGTGKLELFHFDNTTGRVSGGEVMGIEHPYGIEFSPDNSKFYVGQNNLAPIYQFNLITGNEVLILASQTAVSNPIVSTFSFQAAPNNKIYFTQGDAVLGSIEYPNNLGWACSVGNTSISVNSTSSLPNNFNLTYKGSLNCLPNSPCFGNGENFLLPNIFTPNDDGINDVFKIPVSAIIAFNCKIYDRWGVLIRELNAVNEKWDGHTTSGMKCIEGIYYYVFSVKCEDSAEYKKTGVVQLIR